MFFNEEPKDQKGYKGGSDKNLSDIDRYVKPLLNSLGFDCKKAKEDNTSNKQVLYKKGEFDPKDDSTYVLAQIIIVEDLHSIDTRANSNIPEEVVNNTTEENRVKTWWNFLGLHNTYLFLYVKRGNWFILVPYADIPEDHYQLTYRGRPDRKNRMWVPTEYLPKFKKSSHLEEDLKSILNC